MMRNFVSEIGVVLRIGDVMLNRVLEIVDVDGLNVKLVVIMFHFLKKFFVCFTSGSGVKLVAKLVQIFPMLAEIVTPLLAFSQQSLVFGCCNHSVFFFGNTIMFNSIFSRLTRCDTGE
jgi:hypothetical protein